MRPISTKRRCGRRATPRTRRARSKAFRPDLLDQVFRAHQQPLHCSARTAQMRHLRTAQRRPRCADLAHRSARLPQPADLSGGGDAGRRAAAAPLCAQPDGVLFLGKAETQLARSQLFKPVEMQAPHLRQGGAGVAASQRQRAGVRPRIDRTENQPLECALLEAVLNECDHGFPRRRPRAAVVTLANATARTCFRSARPTSAGRSRTCRFPIGRWSCAGRSSEVLDTAPAIRLEHQEYHLPARPIRLRLTIEIRRCRGGRTAAASGAAVVHRHDPRCITLQRELETAQENLENYDRGTAVGERGARDDQRRAAIDQRGARDDQRGAAVHQRGARDDQRGSRSSNEEMEVANEELRRPVRAGVEYRSYPESVLRSMDAASSCSTTT